MKEQLKGVALVLFGILLCCADQGINSSVLANFSDFPFSVLGVIAGIAGIVFVFKKTTNK